MHRHAPVHLLLSSFSNLLLLLCMAYNENLDRGKVKWVCDAFIVTYNSFLS